MYAPYDRKEREETWWEIGAARGLASGPWVLCRDFNTTRYPSEKKNCNRISKAMSNFSEFIEDMELVDPELTGGKYTWTKKEWDSSFRKIRQSILQRVTSDHTPLMLQCGEWDTTKSYFKFENWWLQIEGFNEKVKN
ncbi:unnamed protein product [Withania somnifera]